MSIIDNFISEAFVHALGWTILHSLWQGALIALLLGILLLFLQKQSAKSRYVLSSIGLFVLFATAITTFVVLYQTNIQDTAVTLTVTTEQILSQLDQVTFQDNVNSSQGVFTMAVDYFNQHLPTIVVLWLLGILVMSLRFLGGMAYLQRLKHTQHVPLSHPWQKYLYDIKTRLGIQRSIQLVESALINVPIVIGYLKPMILVPIGTVNGLDHRQVEAILAHELAHIYRHDYLVNIVQSVIEMVLFYHPAVWWISGIIREERENSCDDIAIRLCGDSLNYAKALTNLEAMKLNVPSYSLAFTGKKNQLLNRITRLLGQPQPKKNFSEGLVAVFILVGCLFISTTFNAKSNVGSDNAALEIPVANFETWETDRTPLNGEEERTTTAAASEQLSALTSTPTIAQADLSTEKIQITATPTQPLETFEFVAMDDNHFVKELVFTDDAATLQPQYASFFTSNDTDVVDIKTEKQIIFMNDDKVVIIKGGGGDADLENIIQKQYKKQLSKEEWKAFIEENVKKTTPEEWEAFHKEIAKNKMTEEEWDKFIEENLMNKVTPHELRLFVNGDEDSRYEISRESMEDMIRESQELLGHTMSPDELEAFVKKSYENAKNLRMEGDELTEIRVLKGNSLWSDVDEDKIVIWGGDGKLKIKSKPSKLKGTVISGKSKGKTKSKSVVISGLTTTTTDDEITIFADAKVSGTTLKFDRVAYDKIYDEMLKDGLIESKNKVSISIRKNKKIKINGKEVPNNLRKKYIKLLGVK